jgi:cardiolipin synthase
VTGTRAAAPSAPSAPSGPAETAVSDRVLTVPNALSALRLAGVPVFLWLVLGPEADGWAVLLLMASGWTDYFDGKIARKYGLVSRLGQLLDPLADRLYILTTVLAFTIRGVLPLYLTLILFSRDLFMSTLLPVFRKHGYGPPQVNFMGKAATYNLLYAFPLLLLGAGHNTLATYARTAGWAFLLWGVTLYWWAGLLYVRQLRAVVRPRAVAGTVTP